MSAIRVKVFLTLAIVLQLYVQICQGGFCNLFSSNRGAHCNSNKDCQGGACWEYKYTSPTPHHHYHHHHYHHHHHHHHPPHLLKTNSISSSTAVYTGYCNAASFNCGTPCNIQNDCPGGDCWENMDNCDYIGYCNAASSNCGTSCNYLGDCPGGDCWKELQECTGTGDHVIGTALGALPASIEAPPLSQVPADVNFILLSFAKDPNYDGKFVPFSEWTRLGITTATITQDKATNPNRKYMVSLGGAADYGGTFNIAAGISVNKWLDEAFASIKYIVDSLNADGVDVQFEGGTTNANFPAAIRGILQRFKAAGYFTSVGPYYGGTWNDYVNLGLGNADYVFCQFYAKDLQTVSSVQNDITQAANDLGGWSQLVVGLNSLNRNPNPSIALQVVENLKGDLKGTFTWAAEHSMTNNPPYCIEKNSKGILVDNQSPGSCSW